MRLVAFVLPLTLSSALFSSTVFAQQPRAGEEAPVDDPPKGAPPADQPGASDDPASRKGPAPEVSGDADDSSDSTDAAEEAESAPVGSADESVEGGTARDGSSNGSGGGTDPSVGGEASEDGVDGSTASESSGSAAEGSTAPPPLAGPAAAAEESPAEHSQELPPEDSGGYGDGSSGASKGQAVTYSEEGLDEEGVASDFLVALLLDTSLPLGASQEFVDTFSFQGFGIDVKYLGFGNLTVGGAVAWHTIADKSVRQVRFEVEGTGDATFTGTMVTELSFTPILGKVGYALRDGVEDGERKFVPYAALGFGGSRLVRRLDVGINRLVDESWHWTLVPEVGVEVPVGPIALVGAVRFNYLFQGGGAPEQLYVNFSLGVGLH